MDFRDKQAEAFRWAHAILKHLDRSTSMAKVASLAHFLIQQEAGQTISRTTPTIAQTQCQKSLLYELNEA